VTGDLRAELAVELQFYGLLDRVMPYYAQGQTGVALLKSACSAGATKRALQTAVAQARALVFDLGSTNPWLDEDFQDARYAITDRVVNGAPVWEHEGGERFMYRTGNGMMMISDEESCAAGAADGMVYNSVDSPDVQAPTQLRSKRWRSNEVSTLEPQYTTAGATEEDPWVNVPDMYMTAVHGLDDADPAMAAALRQLATL
jgi:hypothetical protein